MPEDSVEIFCSYAREDETLRQEFEASVVQMRRKKQIDVWHDKRISAGDRWRDQIDEHLDSADIIALFVSRDFLASDFSYEKELSRALEREAKKEAVVVPIIVRDCDWSDAPFAHLQAIPSGAKPVTSWPNRDEAWTDVAQRLKMTVLDILTTRRKKIVEKIYAEIGDDWMRQKEERERILTSLQSQIMAIRQDLGVNRPKLRSASDAFTEMDKYIKRDDIK
jgi:hypothetical protein